MGSCYNSTVVNADCEMVWQLLRDFHQVEWATAVVSKVEVVGTATGTQVGAKRILNDAFHETLVSLDDEARTFSYSIDDGPGPVARGAVENYLGTVRVRPVTDSDRAFVEWTSSYDSPNDTAVGELCNPIYHALLGQLKAHFSNQ